jgi:hypothetical protein
MGLQVSTGPRGIGCYKAETARLPGNPISGDRHQVVILVKAIPENKRPEMHPD